MSVVVFVEKKESGGLDSRERWRSWWDNIVVEVVMNELPTTKKEKSTIKERGRSLGIRDNLSLIYMAM